MRTYFQVYREQYWYTSTESREEAEAIAADLERQGYIAEIKIEGKPITWRKEHKNENGN